MSLLFSDRAILNTDKLLTLTVEERIDGEVSTEAIFDNGQIVKLREEIGRELITGLNPEPTAPHPVSS